MHSWGRIFAQTGWQISVAMTVLCFGLLFICEGMNPTPCPKGDGAGYLFLMYTFALLSWGFSELLNRLYGD